MPKRRNRFGRWHNDLFCHRASRPEATDAGILDRLGKLVLEISPISRFRLTGWESCKAAEVIVHVAKERHSDLIVLGTRGRKGLARFFFGNVADCGTRAAPCPVLALRNSQTDAE